MILFIFYFLIGLDWVEQSGPRLIASSMCVWVIEDDVCFYSFN